MFGALASQVRTSKNLDTEAQMTVSTAGVASQSVLRAEDLEKAETSAAPAYGMSDMPGGAAYREQTGSAAKIAARKDGKSKYGMLPQTKYVDSADHREQLWLGPETVGVASCVGTGTDHKETVGVASCVGSDHIGGVIFVDPQHPLYSTGFAWQNARAMEYEAAAKCQADGATEHSVGIRLYASSDDKVGEVWYKCWTGSGADFKLYVNGKLTESQADVNEWKAAASKFKQMKFKQMLHFLESKKADSKTQ